MSESDKWKSTERINQDVTKYYREQLSPEQKLNITHKNDLEEKMQKVMKHSSQDITEILKVWKALKYKNQYLRRK